MEKKIEKSTTSLNHKTKKFTFLKLLYIQELRWLAQINSFSENILKIYKKIIKKRFISNISSIFRSATRSQLYQNISPLNKLKVYIDEREA